MNVATNSGGTGGSVGSAGIGGTTTPPPVVTPPSQTLETRPGFGFGDTNHIHTRTR